MLEPEKYQQENEFQETSIFAQSTFKYHQQYFFESHTSLSGRLYYRGYFYQKTYGNIRWATLSLKVPQIENSHQVSDRCEKKIDISST